MVQRASTAPALGHIDITRSLPARGRRAPRRGCAMARSTTVVLEPHEIALVRGGRRAAVTVAVLDLHLRGVVRAGRRGTMRTTGPATGTALPRLTRAVHAALHRPAGMGQLLERRGVRTAPAEARDALASAGLLRAFPPGRTGAARRSLKELRAASAARGPGRPDGRKDPVRGRLYGDRALTALVPGFTRDAVLTGRGGTTERALPGASCGSGGLSCASA
ncbi:TIGR04222 domain-containing membrane protein [Streptomyces sp. NPDC048419]|uniref:TIGR04222 domain-containing membrane protein n=1 Tax=Streptomyces sp. NPDC048419 TaxID=3365547 RepID=UPI003718E76C